MALRWLFRSLSKYLACCVYSPSLFFSPVFGRRPLWRLDAGLSSMSKLWRLCVCMRCYFLLWWFGLSLLLECCLLLAFCWNWRTRSSFFEERSRWRVDNLVSYQYLEVGLKPSRLLCSSKLFCMIKCHSSKTRHFWWAPAIPTGMLFLHGETVGVVVCNTAVDHFFTSPWIRSAPLTIEWVTLL